MRSLYYDRQGQPIDTTEWARRLEDREYARVAEDYFEGVRISTVWLGLDHSHLDGPPLIFETMTFDDSNDEQGQWRYTTEAEAVAGHYSVVKAIQDRLRIPDGAHEDRVIPHESRPLADVEPGSVDISGLDKAELLAALVNAMPMLIEIMFSAEDAAALIQDRLGGAHGDVGPVFRFGVVAARRIDCDLTGPRISKAEVERYDTQTGEGSMERVISALRLADERQREERRRRAAGDYAEA